MVSLYVQYLIVYIQYQFLFVDRIYVDYVSIVPEGEHNLITYESFDISPEAISSLSIGREYLEFTGSFRGRVETVLVRNDIIIRIAGVKDDQLSH